MADTPTAMRDALAVANRILAHEGILDAFGHVSLRHPAKPDRYLLARSCAPALVEPDDIYEYDLESRPTRSCTLPHYSERVIHGEIYKARPDVMAVCHHHAPAFMPLLVTGTPYQPVFPLGAVGGADVAFWDQHREFGDTNLLVTKPEEGRSLAEAFGANWMVLMNRHGVTVGGVSLQDVVFRCIYSAHNADYQTRGAMLGRLDPLRRAEIELIAANLSSAGQARAWDYWLSRLRKAGGMPAPSRAGAGQAADPLL